MAVVPLSRPDAPKLVLLCGGQGTRMREETEYRPKPMVEVGGKPILWHIMKTYAAHGFTDFVCCLGYRGRMIKQYFLDYHAHARPTSPSPSPSGTPSSRRPPRRRGLARHARRHRRATP